MKIAELDEARLTKLQELEDELETVLIAPEPASPLADLSQEQVNRLQEAKKELSLVMLAYEK